MNMKGTSPCALHAWGNQLTACPCGCRPVGLSTKRLEEKGLLACLFTVRQTMKDRLSLGTFIHVRPLL